MALDTIDVEIDGLKFHILQFGGMAGLKLEKRILTLMAPMLKVLDGVKDVSESDMDMKGLADAVQSMLLDLDDSTLERLVSNLVEKTSINFVGMNGEDGGVQSLNKEIIFNDVFAGKNLTIIKLLVEIMKANRFAFFELVGGGTLKTNFLKNLNLNGQS